MAILSAKPEQKLSQLDAGLESWAQALCTSATCLHRNLFHLGLGNAICLGGEEPADWSYRLVAMGLSTYLGLNALDGAEEDSNGRVRQFVRNVVREGPASTSFPLRGWFARRTFGARLGTRDQIPSLDGTLSTHQTNDFIRAAEVKLTKRLLDALSDLRENAIIETGANPEESDAVRHSPENAPALPPPIYRSRLKRGIRQVLLDNPDATNYQVCDGLDEQGLPAQENGDRTFQALYQDPDQRAILDSTISKVRRDMRGCGQLQ
jgi:hypothetical protein